MAKNVITFCSKSFLTTTALLVMVIANSMVFSYKEGWEKASATFYGDRSGGGTRSRHFTFSTVSIPPLLFPLNLILLFHQRELVGEGACGYDGTLSQGYGLQTTALGTALFNNGLACGACYQLRCHNDPKWCLPGMVAAVSATNFCPPNWSKPSGKGGWCNPPRKHFDLSMPAFLRIGTYKGGIIPVLYRRIPCVKRGGIRFEIKPNSNPYWIAVLVFNVGGAGDVHGVRIKGTNTDWITMSRNWGQVWQTSARLLGQALSFEVTAGDGRMVPSDNVASSHWFFGQTFEGKQF